MSIHRLIDQCEKAGISVKEFVNRPDDWDGSMEDIRREGSLHEDDDEPEWHTSYFEMFVESFLDMVAKGLAVLTVLAIFLIGYRLITVSNLIAELVTSLSR